ncbi:D-glucuronyl C5-epimerase family protein [Deinococcus radiophilus]|uniref:D-glucuronyl C5-epimerase C-terminal domain-containing protein n=1 Tax=Deinococcus radiophilus TaxID=32062 RepID=A0A3S0IQB1_9DEIO|nr:D-glucuronyl C5-epimerase family protein [Deinococcus radiophilus]RTR29077.1 hypothetical protein EJ104_04325 [Deinococcus radiophilus]UFA49663.1 D-glucuronyl C5-epimerase family protein [Deinococcus radiophilus]
MRKALSIAAGSLLLALSTACGAQALPASSQPTSPAALGFDISTAEVRAEVQKTRDEHFKVNTKVEWSFVPGGYTARGNYLNYAIKFRDRKYDHIRYDENGLPERIYGDAYYKTPVLIAQHGLTGHARLVTNTPAEQAQYAKTDYRDMVNSADWLITSQNAKGCFEYHSPFRYYLSKTAYEPGWISGMAQGQGMSLLARTFDVTKDVKYINAAKRAMDCMVLSVDQGGTREDLGAVKPEWSNKVIFEEYLADPPGYTLNGFMFSLLGLYDLSQVAPDAAVRNQAALWFRRGTDTLETILPLFDMDGISAYDLGYLTYDRPVPHMSASYHIVHIYLLHAMNDVTNNAVLEKYERIWREDINQ